MPEQLTPTDPRYTQSELGAKVSTIQSLTAQEVARINALPKGRSVNSSSTPINTTNLHARTIQGFTWQIAKEQKALDDAWFKYDAYGNERSTLTFANFHSRDLEKFLNLQAPQVDSLLARVNGLELSDTQIDALRSIPESSYSNIESGLLHLNAHPKGSRYSGDFNPMKTTFNFGKMFDRLFTVRPKSFTPGNLSRAAAVGAVAVATGGVGVAPFAGVAGYGGTGAGMSILAQPGAINPFSSFTGALATKTEINIEGVQLTSGPSQHDTSVAQAGATGFYSFGQTQAGDPSKKETWYNKISRMVGGAAAAYGTTAGISSYLTPLSANSKLASYGAQAVNKTSSAFTGAQVGQIVVSILGNKVGGALLSLVSGDLSGAINIITRDDPQQPNRPGSTNDLSPYGSFGGGGGGSGLGISPSGNTGLSTINPVWYAVAGLALLVVLFAVMRRKSR